MGATAGLSANAVLAKVLYPNTAGQASSGTRASFSMLSGNRPLTLNPSPMRGEGSKAPAAQFFSA